MANPDSNETLPLDPRSAAGASSPALPFQKAQALAGVQRAVLRAPEGAALVPIALETIVWRHEGALSLTVVVKASFSMASSPMTPAAAADPFRSQDVHRKNQPLAHVVAASDRAPLKPRVDVTVLGTACAPEGRPVPELAARFSVLQGGVAVLDKVVRVVGDRDAPDASPAAFTRMPVTWERAYGGKIPANPIGCSGEDDDQPNVLDPANVWRPAGFGPVAAGWPLRAKRLGAVTRRQLDAFVMELPAGFDFSYFQSAPQDQQLEALDDTAVIALEGFDPGRGRVEASLPGPRAVGAVYGLDEGNVDAPVGLDFRLDTLHIDAERWVCTAVFRASARVAGEGALPGLLVAAGVGVNGAEPAIPTSRPEPTLAASPSPSGAGGAPTTGTLDPRSRRAGAGATLPFTDGGSQGDRETLLLPPEAQTLPFAPPPIPQEKVTAAPAPHPILPSMITPPQGSEPAMISPAVLAPAEPPAPPPLLGPITPAAARELTPEEEIDLERCAAITAALEEPGARRDDVLASHGVTGAVWTKASRHWKRAMDQELRRARPALRDLFDDVYVTCWEQEHPDHFGLAEYTRLVRAEKAGHLALELSNMGLSLPLGMRLRRVWSKRVSNDDGLAKRLAELLANG